MAESQSRPRTAESISQKQENNAGNSFKFSPTKHDPARYDSPAFRFASRKPAADSGQSRDSFQTPSLMRQKSGASSAEPDSHAGSGRTLRVSVSAAEREILSRGSSLSAEGAQQVSTASPSGALPLSPQSPRTQQHPLGITPLPLPLSPAQRHQSSASSTSSSQSSSALHARHQQRSPRGEDSGNQRRKGTLERETIALAAGTVTVALAANAAAMGCDVSPEKVVQRTWDWLAEQPEDAAELAQLLYEATPKLGVAAARSPHKNLHTKGSKRPATEETLPLLERLQNAEPMPTGSGEVDWTSLTMVCSSEVLRFEETTAAAIEALEVASLGGSSRRASRDKQPSPQISPRGELVEVNSGGQVLFCFFTPPERMAFAPERVLIVKFHQSRLSTQSEQFANELTRHLGICAPSCRILRQHGPSQEEWKEATTAAAGLGKAGSELEEQLSKSASCLVMDYVPGKALFEAQEPFQPSQIHQTTSDLGRLLLLDMLLGNPDRLQCSSLGWRGNSQNLRYCTKGPFAGRIVVIDAVVQRRPPGGLVSQEDAGCNQLTELALNDVGFAGEVLTEAVGLSETARQAVQDRDLWREFQGALRHSLQAMMHIKGLLEMMFEVLSVWIEAFIKDIEGLEAAEALTVAPQPSCSAAQSNGSTPPPSANTSPRGASHHLHTPSGGDASSPARGSRWGLASPSQPTITTTQKIKSIGREARQNLLISERLNDWKATMRERGEELRSAVEEWQAKHSRPDMPTRLTTGFLDGTHPVVDIYELKVRLEHMLQRSRALQDAAATARPTQLLPFLYVSGAVEASSLHVLRRLGVTHLLNATEDLLLPDESAGFESMRCPIRDEEEVDIGCHFQAAFDFIEKAKASGGSVLVHCHEGKSRSVTLVLAYLMTTQEWTFKEALEFVSAARPQASPNAGFMARLLELEQKLHGKRTVKVKRTKPEPRVCPVCSAIVGISAQSLALHVKKAHPGAV